MSAEARPCYKRSHIEGNDSFRLQCFGHITLHDAIRNAFGNGRLANARFADEHRIVFCATRKNLQHAADFFVPPNHRIHLSLPGKIIQIPAITLKRLIFFFGSLIGDALIPANLFEHLENRIDCYALVKQQFARSTVLRLDHCQQQMLCADKFVFQILCLPGCALKESAQILRQRLIRNACAADLRKSLDCFVDLDLREVDVGANLLQNGNHCPTRILHECSQQVFGFNHLIAVARGNFLSVLYGFLGFYGKLIEVHFLFSLNVRISKPSKDKLSPIVCSPCFLPAFCSIMTSIASCLSFGWKS